MMSPDGGRRWTPRGRLEGRPEAFTAAGSELFAASGGLILASSADGKTWNVRFRDPSAN